MSETNNSAESLLLNLVENNNNTEYVSTEIPTSKHVDFQFNKYGNENKNIPKESNVEKTDRQILKEEMLHFSQSLDYKMSKFMDMMSQNQTTNVGMGTKRPNCKDQINNLKRSRQESTATIS